MSRSNDASYSDRLSIALDQFIAPLMLSDEQLTALLVIINDIYEDGIDRGNSQGYDNGYHDGLEEGEREGYSSGHRDGLDDGYQNALDAQRNEARD